MERMNVSDRSLDQKVIVEGKRCVHCQAENMVKLENWLKAAPCDICRDTLIHGGEYWRCRGCKKDICSLCYDEGLVLIVGNYVEVSQELAIDNRIYRRGTRGVVTNIQLDTRQYRVRFSNTCCCSRDEYIDDAQLKNLIIVDEPMSSLKTFCIAILIAGLFTYGIINGKKCERLLEHLIHWCKTLGLWAPVLIFIVCSILPVIMIPVFPMMALSGPLFTEMYDKNAIWGGTVAFIAVFGGLWLGSVVAFALGKTVLKGVAEKYGNESSLLKRVNRIVDHGGLRIILMARALPVLPAEVFDYACALTNLKVWQYAVGCFGSAVPVAFWTYSSAQASLCAQAHARKNGRVGHHLFLLLINIIALVLLTLMLVFTLKSMDTTEGDTNEALTELTTQSPPMLLARQASSDLDIISKSPKCCDKVNLSDLGPDVELIDGIEKGTSYTSLTPLATEVK